MFNYYYGPVHLAMIDAYKLEELDIGLVNHNLDKARADLKAKSEKKRAHAELTLDYLEPLQQQLEDMEFSF